jgi:hypothetical protein
VSDRYRCAGCGNLTRFDVVGSRRTRAFHHFTVGGELEVEDEVVLEEQIESVTCRWCGATGDRIERLGADDTPTPGRGAPGGGAPGAPVSG